MKWPTDLAADERGRSLRKAAVVLDWEEPKIAGSAGSNLPSVDEVAIFKADEEKRIVFGEVLVPESRDLQGDIYSEEVIAEAAHNYLADFHRGRLGEQHNASLVDEVSLFESYIAPVDMEINGRTIKRGTWLMTWKIHDNRLWGKVKRGEITGFSIGGIARETPG